MITITRARLVLTALLMGAGTALPAAAQVVLVQGNGVSFGQIDYNAAMSSIEVKLGSNGSVTYDANSSGSGFGTAGQIEIQALPGTLVSIACDTNATLANSGGHTVTLDNVRFNIGSGSVTGYTGGIACTGLGNGVASHTVGSDAADNTIFVGGRLTFNGVTAGNGLFNGTNSGGALPAFRVLVQ